MLKKLRSACFEVEKYIERGKRVKKDLERLEKFKGVVATSLQKKCVIDVVFTVNVDKPFFSIIKWLTLCR